jgi:hypothetical protein
MSAMIILTFGWLAHTLMNRLGKMSPHGSSTGSDKDAMVGDVYESIMPKRSE